MNLYLDGMRFATVLNSPASRGRKEIRDGRSLRWEKARQIKAGRSDSAAHHPFPVLRKACLASLPSLDDDAESLPTFFAKSISSMTGESGGTEAEDLEKNRDELCF